MAKAFEKVAYAGLGSRQKENFNFHKASSILAEYGYTSLRLSDDWNGADFIALHIDGHSLRVQLKGRLTFNKKYNGKEIWVCFPAGNDAVYVYPHDELFVSLASEGRMTDTKSWTEGGDYSFPRLSHGIKNALEPYRLSLETGAPKSS